MTAETQLRQLRQLRQPSSQAGPKGGGWGRRCTRPLSRRVECQRGAVAPPACLQVRAVRGGQELAVPVCGVLVGDLLLVEAGDILCADGLLVAGSDVK